MNTKANFAQTERRRRRFLLSLPSKIEKALNKIGTKPTNKKFERMLFEIWVEVGLPFAKSEFNLLKSTYIPMDRKQEFSESDFMDAVKTYLGQNAADRIKGMTQATKDIIKVILQRAADEGLGTEETARFLRDELKLRNKVRARVIARTEISAASNFGNFQGATMTGLKLLKQWSSAKDSRVRDDHVDLDGTIRKMNKPFPHGLMFPADPSGPADQVINCRCAVKYVPI